MTIANVTDSRRGNVSKIKFVGGYEASFMEKNDATKFVICVSSQVGCPMRCSFCHLTELGMSKGVRNLSAREIAAQVNDTIRHQYANGRLPADKDCIVSFMAMGEPMLNIDEVLGSLPLIETGRPPEFTGRFRYDISTVLPKSASLSTIPSEKKIRVFYSLHSPLPETRRKLIPQSRSIPDAFAELVAYYRRTGIKPIIHHTFIEGQNDSEQEIQAIIDLMTMPEHVDFQLRVLRYNPYNASQRESRKLLDIIELLERHIYVKLHRSPGFEISAACGQFLGH
jgi:23S rRNA (adenine2503-C2)-methyltransferase